MTVSFRSPGQVKEVRATEVWCHRGAPDHPTNPSRLVYQYWDAKEGRLLAEFDDCNLGLQPDQLGYEVLRLLDENKRLREQLAAHGISELAEGEAAKEAA